MVQKIRQNTLKVTTRLLVCIHQMPTLDYNAFLLSGSLAYISFCVNPVIYASRYEVFRRQLKQMLNKNAVAPSNAGGITNTTQPAATQH